jgi:hypothetical protein
MVPTQTTSSTTGGALNEVTPLIDAPAFYGPPVVFFAAPWLVLGVLLSGPAAALLALIAALAIMTALLAGVALLLASPFLLVRRHRRAHTAAGRPVIDVRRVTA